MYKNSLKTIAVFITELHSEYQNVMCKNIERRAGELGYNVAFFCWDNPYGQQRDYIYGESNIFNLPDYSGLDGVIYFKDTFSDAAVERMIEEKLDKIDVPKVTVRGKLDGYYNVIVDNATGISELVRHFIVKHKCTKIAYMSGKKHMLDAQLRLAAYESVMKEYNMVYDESYIFHGDYWRDKAVEACDHFLNSPLGIPEAIVCANDYMALSLMDELIDRGYRVPEDILISGFDNVSEAVESIPQLTTVDMPFKKMACGAVDIIDNVLNGREQERMVILDAEPVYRKSCGCTDDDICKKGKRKISNSNYSKIFSANKELRYMTVALEEALTLEQLSSVIDGFMYIHDNYKNFFMCLTKKDKNSGFNTVSTVREGYTEDSLCALAIIDRGHTGDYPLVFRTQDMVPPIYVTEEPQIYYFMPLHFLDINYGYVAINYYDNGRHNESFSTFITQISSALDSIYNKAQLQRTLNELELLYITDPLTNLYNRRGFEKMASDVVEDCRKNNTPVMVMTIDMDDMKKINDNYGHLQGDRAIKMIGKALSCASCGKEICARVGGDEFNVIAGDYSAEECDRFIADVLKYMESYNEENPMPFNVEISYGSVLIDEFDTGNLENYMKSSDDRMYEQKFRKKKGRDMENY
ncbi:MAG: GGDEF domain-containing protein [Lachnospiraceae bacterium]|nr:GGDEF domain-containing protein [Lachnospiraceae bacterium]